MYALKRMSVFTGPVSFITDFSNGDLQTEVYLWEIILAPC